MAEPGMKAEDLKVAAAKGVFRRSKREMLSRGKLVVFSVLATVLAVLLAEAGIRVWAYYFRTPYERYNWVRDRYELIPNTRFTMRDGKEFLVNSRGFAGPEFAPKKLNGAYRIFALGDSCTLGYWRYVYPHMLEVLLNDQSPDRRFEVINAGIEGYNSEDALRRLQEDILQHGPDMVIIYIGWNDLMKVNPNSADAPGRFGRLARTMESSYLVKAYRKTLFFYLRPLVIKPGTVDDGSAAALNGFVPKVYRRNLEAMVRVLLDRGVAPVVVTLPTVLRPGMTNEELERRRVFFPYYAGAYSVKRLLALHRSYNDAVRAVASAHDVAVVDLATVFNEQKTKDVLFWDVMHPSVEGHHLIARSLTPTVLNAASKRERGPLGRMARAGHRQQQ